MMLGAPEATAVGAMSATFEQTLEIPIVPILGIYAGPSRIATRESVLKYFPKAEYTATPDTGHFLMLEKPEEFNRLLLAFLSRQEY